MRSLAVVVVVLAVALAAGCNKKKDTKPADSQTPTGQGQPDGRPQPAAGGGDDGPTTWARSNSGGPKPSTNTNPEPAPSGNPQNNPGIVVTGAGGGVVTNPMAATGGGGGGGGAAMAVRKAVVRTAKLNDLKQVHLYMDTASGASGRMPSPQETYAALKQEAPHIAKEIDEGVIVLHPAKSREDVWAYEGTALQQGGYVVTNQGIEKMDASTLKTRLGVR